MYALRAGYYQQIKKCNRSVHFCRLLPVTASTFKIHRCQILKSYMQQYRGEGDVDKHMVEQIF